MARTSEITVTLRRRRVRALVWDGRCDRVPKEEELLRKARARGLRAVVVVCAGPERPSLGAAANYADCYYRCPGEPRDFGLRARKGETAREACARGLRDRAPASEVPRCELVRARFVE